MAALTQGGPVGALDIYTPQQSPLVDERDPYALARDMLRQRGIAAESEIEKIKGDKWGKIFNALGAFGAGIQGRDASRYSLQNRIQPYQDVLTQAQNGMSDLSLQQWQMQQKLAQAQRNHIGTYNPRDYTPESWAAFVQGGASDPSLLQRYEAFTQDSVRWVPDGNGGVRPMVTDDQRMDAGRIDAQIAYLTKMREEMGKGKGEAAVSDEVGDARAEIALKTENAKNNAGAANDMYTQAQKLSESIPNYNDAIAAIDEGAATGRVVGMLPSFRSSTLRFEAAANRLGLNVIGQTTFGALSEGEMRLAMETAVPRGLEGPELRAWLVAKRDAEQKLIQELVSAAEYLEGGGSRARLQELYLQGGEPKTSGQGDPAGAGTVDLPAPSSNAPSIDDLVNKYAN